MYPSTPLSWTPSSIYPPPHKEEIQSDDQLPDPMSSFDPFSFFPMAYSFSSSSLPNFYPSSFQMNQPSTGFNQMSWPRPINPLHDTKKDNSPEQRKMKKFPEWKINALNIRYSQNRFIQLKERTELAKTLNMTPDQVKIWFQNRRYKDRQKGILPKENCQPSPSYLPNCHPSPVFPSPSPSDLPCSIPPF